MLFSLFLLMLKGLSGKSTLVLFSPEHGKVKIGIRPREVDDKVRPPTDLCGLRGRGGYDAEVVVLQVDLGLVHGVCQPVERERHGVRIQ